MLDRREPPQDLDAERALLGCLLLDCSDFDESVSIIGTVEAFFVPQHRRIYQIVRDIHDAGQPLDLAVFVDWARRNKYEDLARLQDDAIVLSESFADVGNATHYARIVHEHFQRRELIGLGNRLVNEAHDVGNNSTDLRHKYAGQLDAPNVHDATCVDAVELIRALPAYLDDPARGFIETGLTAIDTELGGLERGAMTIVAAQTSAGKTAIGLAFAVHAAQSETPCLFVSVEMLQSAIALRIVGLLAGFSAHRLRSGVVSKFERDSAFEQAAKLLSSGRLWVTGNVNNLRDIVAVAKQHVRRHNVGLVVADYLQLCQPGERAENRNLEVAGMSAAFKRLALQTGAAVVVLSQLNRESASRAECRACPTCAMGAIEQDADVVLMLHKNNDEPAGDTVAVQCRVAKNRNGPTLDFTLDFHRPTMRFQNRRVGA